MLGLNQLYHGDSLTAFIDVLCCIDYGRNGLFTEFKKEVDFAAVREGRPPRP